MVASKVAVYVKAITCSSALIGLLAFVLAFDWTSSNAQTTNKKKPSTAANTVANAANTVSNAVKKAGRGTPPTNANIAPMAVRVKYDDKPFSPQQEIVPIGYEGHNPERIAIEIYIGDAYSRKKKGEFETTEEYQRKIDEALSKPICCSFGGEPLTLKSLIAFKIRGFQSLYIDMAYDADKGVMEMAVLPDYYGGDDRFERDLFHENTFTLFQGKVSDNQIPYFTTQTKKRVMVRSIKYPLYKLTVVNMKDFRSENFATYEERKKGSFYPSISGKKAIVARVKMSGDEAKALKGYDSYVVSDDKGVRIEPKVDSSLDVLFVGNLTHPYLVRNDSEEKATLIKPTNVEKEFYYMSFSLKQVWFYNSKTGRIYAKVGNGFETSTQDARSLPKPPTDVKITKEDNNVEGKLKRARDFYKSGADDEALIQLRQILASEPMNGESYFLLGKIHTRRDDIDQAISSFKAAIFWDNRLIDAHLGLGKIYVEKGDCIQAKNYSASALEIDSQNAEALRLKQLSDRCTK